MKRAQLISATPIPVHRVAAQTLTVIGLNIQAGFVPSFGTASTLTAAPNGRQQFTLSHVFAAGTYGLSVRNPDDKVSNVLPIYVAAVSSTPPLTNPLASSSGPASSGAL